MRKTGLDSYTAHRASAKDNTLTELASGLTDDSSESKKITEDESIPVARDIRLVVVPYKWGMGEVLDGRRYVDVASYPYKQAVREGPVIKSWKLYPPPALVKSLNTPVRAIVDELKDTRTCRSILSELVGKGKVLHHSLLKPNRYVSPWKGISGLYTVTDLAPQYWADLGLWRKVKKDIKSESKPPKEAKKEATKMGIEDSITQMLRDKLFEPTAVAAGSAKSEKPKKKGSSLSKLIAKKKKDSMPSLTEVEMRKRYTDWVADKMPTCYVSTEKGYEPYFELAESKLTADAGLGMFAPLFEAPLSGAGGAPSEESGGYVDT
jgi:hypothetical protein